jgi:hypothetical protein
VLNDVFLVMLLTAQRCGEVCQMQWREVDLDTGWWLIPGDVSKNHDPHRVPLTTMVLEILGRRSRAENADDRYVFSNHRHTCVAARAKKAAAILCNGGVSFHFRAHISAMGMPSTLMSSRGHTRGSVVYLLDDQVLFSGDSLAWSARAQDLVAFKDACWYSWTELTASLGALAAYRFEWLLPGHGWPVHLPADEMKARLLALVARMRQT